MVGDHGDEVIVVGACHVVKGHDIGHASEKPVPHLHGHWPPHVHGQVRWDEWPGCGQTTFTMQLPHLVFFFKVELFLALLLPLPVLVLQLRRQAKKVGQTQGAKPHESQERQSTSSKRRLHAPGPKCDSEPGALLLP